MTIEILAPNKKIFAGTVSLIQLTGYEGSFEILDNHAPMVAMLKAGKIKVCDENNQILYFEINGGVVEVKQNHIAVLAT